MQSARWIATLVTAAMLLLPACAEAPSDEHVVDEPVMVEKIEGTDGSLVTLEARAVERLDVRTATVTRRGSHLIVPSGAVLVDPEEHFWVYTNPEPLLFFREEIHVSHENGDEVFLSDGPRPGTRVVTVGVAELYGAEFGIGH
jgi:hypothetical protein